MKKNKGNNSKPAQLSLHRGTKIKGNLMDINMDSDPKQKDM